MTSLVRSWIAERIPPAVFVPAVAALWLCARWAADQSALNGAGALSLALLTALVLQFRLWDDLEDAGRDRLVHPARVLAQATAGVFRRLLGIWSAAVLALAAASTPAVFAGVVALDVWFLVAYRVVRPRVPDAVWRFPLLLAKYPAFVCLTALAMAPSRGGRLIVASLAAIAGACVYEAVHDHRQPAGETS
jgi:hypothetical protein